MVLKLSNFHWKMTNYCVVFLKPEEKLLDFPVKLYTFPKHSRGGSEIWERISAVRFVKPSQIPVFPILTFLPVPGIAPFSHSQSMSHSSCIMGRCLTSWYS